MQEAAQVGPVTGADVQRAVALAVDALRRVAAADWQLPAGNLSWTRWETVEHLADALLGYAAQLGPAQPPQDSYVPFAWQRPRPDGPPNAIHADPEAGPAGLLQVLEACAALLVAIVDKTPPHVRAHHVYGASDPAGFAAMGVVETLLHTYDVTVGTGIDWNPPAELCDRALARLFSDAPVDTDRWPTLLWATGRGEIPGRAAVGDWQWDGTPRGDRS
jgi:hypothetical protein